MSVKIILTFFTVAVWVFFKPTESYDQKKIHRVIDRLRPYHVTIFQNRPRDMKINARAPSIVVDLRDMISKNDTRSLSMKILKNPRQTTVYVVLVKKTGRKNETLDVLDQLVGISPVRSRPKSLLVLLDDDWSDGELKNVLKYAWSLKFLDFSIVKTIGENKTIFMSYNPFTGSFLKSTRKFFPGKLNDLNKHPLALPGFDFSPYFSIDGDKKPSGLSFDDIDKVVKKMNFDLRVDVDTNNEVMELFERVLEKLEKNEGGISPIAFYSWRLIDRKLIMSEILQFDELSIVVPIVKTSRVYFSFEVFLYILSFPVIIAIFFVFAKVSNFRSRGGWNVLYIFQIFIGYPASSPLSRVEKITFLLISILSIIYSNIFFDKFADMRFVEEELEFDSLVDVFESKMSIYSIYGAKSDDPSEIQRLFNMSKTVHSDYDCINKVIETRSSICIVSRDLARSFIRKNVDSREMPIMKLIERTIRPDSLHIAYEKASPFAAKFDRIFRQLKESGIRKNRKKVLVYHTELDSNKVEDILVYELMIILITGWFLSLIIFLMEMKHHHNKV